MVREESLLPCMGASQTVLKVFMNPCPDLFLPEAVSMHRVATVCSVGNDHRNETRYFPQPSVSELR